MNSNKNDHKAEIHHQATKKNVENPSKHPTMDETLSKTLIANK